MLFCTLATACASAAPPRPALSPTASSSTAATSTPAPSASPTPTPTATPAPTPIKVSTPTPTKTPFLGKLLADGSAQFVQVTGAPAGSVCTPKAMLRSGRDISGPGLKPQTVANAANGVSWSSPPGPALLTIPSPTPSPGDAYWQVTCTNAAFDPSSATATHNFSIS